jgi:hypothetical protein
MLELPRDREYWTIWSAWIAEQRAQPAAPYGLALVVRHLTEAVHVTFC